MSATVTFFTSTVIPTLIFDPSLLWLTPIQHLDSFLLAFSNLVCNYFIITVFIYTYVYFIQCSYKAVIVHRYKLLWICRRDQRHSMYYTFENQSLVTRLNRGAIVISVFLVLYKYCTKLHPYYGHYTYIVIYNITWCIHYIIYQTKIL